MIDKEKVMSDLLDQVLRISEQTGRTPTEVLQKMKELRQSKASQQPQPPQEPAEPTP